MTRYRSFDVLSGEGYVIESNFPLPVEAEQDSFTWTGDGTGAGTLEIIGDYQYIATTRNFVQNNPTARKATTWSGIEAGQLDIGVIE